MAQQLGAVTYHLRYVPELSCAGQSEWMSEWVVSRQLCHLSCTMPWVTDSGIWPFSCMSMNEAAIIMLNSIVTGVNYFSPSCSIPLHYLPFQLTRIPSFLPPPTPTPRTLDPIALPKCSKSVYGMALLWQPEVVYPYLALIEQYSGCAETMEAATVAIQNVTACNWKECCPCL